MITDDSKGQPDEAVGDENVQRLLAEAYRPQPIDEGFVRQVHEQVRAAAKTARKTSPVVFRTRGTDAGRRTWPLVVRGGFVAVLVASVVFLVSRNRPSVSPPFYRDGQLVWINGDPYIAASGPRQDGKSSSLVPVVDTALDRGEQDRLLRIADGLRPRQRRKPAVIEQIVPGESLVTGRGERRKVVLSDGSILYVNENSTINVDAERRITLDRGEIFLDVTTAADANGDTFVVNTPRRDIVALGTKFSVNVSEFGTGVVVTQGKVQVTGIDRALEAGQQLAARDADGRRVAPVPRASHVLQWTRELMVSTESPLVPGSEFRGGALLAIDFDGQQSKLSLRKYHVDVHIENGFARTTIDQTYFNHHVGRLEGTFYFPLPADASISRLAMYVNGRLMEGGMLERDRARQVFETIKYRALDPALLEWIDGTTFKMRVFPLEGRQEKRIVLSYTQKLDNHYGDTRYRFPVGLNMDTVGNWSVKVHVVNGSQWTWNCPSHTLNAAEINGDLILTSSEKEIRLERDLVVDLHQRNMSADGLPEQGRFSSVDHDGWRYLMLQFRPQVPMAKRRQRRDWIFLIESDGSRDPLLARVQADIVRRMLENSEHQDTFAMITAATRRRAFAAESKPVNRENIEAAAGFLDATHLVGALDLEQALKATQAYARDAKNPVLVHIGDGTPILGERQNNKLLANLAEGIRYVGIGVGKRWNRTFMKSAASRTGGYFTQINPDESIDWRVFELMSTLDSPRLLDLRVDTDKDKAEFLCFRDWAIHGEEVCVIARFKPDQASVQSVTVAGSIDGRPYRQTIAVDNVVEDADYLPRTWAKLAIDQMVARDAAGNRAEIVELSKSMYVMSPFTSLLVLENDAMYQQYDVDRGRKDHWALYACPVKIDVVHEPLGPSLGPSVPALAKPTPLEVMRSLRIRGGTPIGLVAPPHIPFGGPAGLTAQVMTNHSYTDMPMPNPSAVFSVVVPDGGTVMLGGLRFPTAGAGVPILSELPNIGRLFKNQGRRSRDEDLMLLISPRIIIREEDEIEAQLNRLLSQDFLDHGGGAALADFDSLIELIESTISPDSWEQEGAGVEPYPANLSLIISSTQEVHQPLFDEMWASVFPIHRRPQQPSKSLSTSSTSTDPRSLDRCFQYVMQRLANDIARPNLRYLTPEPANNDSMFRQLVRFIPAFRTTWSDALTAIENEAEVPNPLRRGKIDERARELIVAARGRNWQRVTLRDRAGHVVLQLLVDGQGRFRYERKTEHELREIVVCDGTTLRHLYPELGLATVRRMSRFYRAELQRLVPGLILPAEDLATGADLRMIGPQTVAVVPHAFDQAADDKDEVRQQVRVHLVFADDGRLAERRLVAFPSGETMGRVVNAADGSVRWFGRDGKVQEEYRITLKPTSAPNLSPDTKSLVVLPMPMRVRNHVRELIKRRHESTTDVVDRISNPAQERPAAGGVLELIVNELGRLNGDDPANLNQQDALQLVAACYWQDSAEMRNIIARRFFTRGDRRLGFYTLLFSSGVHWDASEPVAIGDGTTVRMDPLADHPESPLARYIASHRRGPETEANKAGHQIDERDGFVGQLSQFRRLSAIWRGDDGLSMDSEVRRRQLDEAFDFMASCDGPTFARVLLRQIQHRCGDRQPHRRIAKALIALEQTGVTCFVVKYELARSLAVHGKRDQARQLFVHLYRESLEQGWLPPIDSSFCKALGYANGVSADVSDPFTVFDGESTAFGLDELMRNACARLVERQRRPLAITLAWQLRQLGYNALADRLFDQALSGMADSERVVTTLAALDYLVQLDRFERADALLQLLLKDPIYAKSSSLWRLAAQVADDGGKAARYMVYLEKAVDLDYDALTNSYDVEPIRENYRLLLEQYERLTNLLAIPEMVVPFDLVARTIRQADRWRSLDTDGTAACTIAARLLTALGHEELAWDYLTTPLALQPNEAAPWVNLAETLRDNTQFKLADRAYATAFNAEPTNAQILWDQAELRERWGPGKDADKLYSKIATGEWQPRFDRLKRESQRRRSSFPAQKEP
jgi:Tfp pilus assembly protein PilF